MISSEIWKGHNRVGPPWSFSESSSAVGVAPRANEFTKSGGKRSSSVAAAGAMIGGAAGAALFGPLGDLSERRVTSERLLAHDQHT